MLLVRGSSEDLEELERELRAAEVAVERRSGSRERGANELVDAVLAQLVATGAIEAIRPVVAAFRRRHGSRSITTDEPEESQDE